MKKENEYAEALYLLTEEKGTTEPTVSECTQWLDVLADEEYFLILSSPSLPVEERKRLLAEALGDHASQDVMSLLLFMTERKHARQIPEALREYCRIAKLRSGRIAAQLYSATEWTQKQKETVVSALEQQWKKKIEPSFFVEPSLLGGIRVEAEGKVYDGSLFSRLRRIKEVMNQ